MADLSDQPKNCRGLRCAGDLNRILKRAGVPPWPKLFHNLRASRETELADTFPEHVVCKWIGNSRVVARRHYLQVTEEHFFPSNLWDQREGGAKSGAA